jgi:hypothetical protein
MEGLHFDGELPPPEHINMTVQTQITIAMAATVAIKLVRASFLFSVAAT